MKKSIRIIKNFINDLEGYSYINKAKYMVFLVCKSLCNHHKIRDMAIFTEYDIFDLKVEETEGKVAEFMNKNAGNIDISNFYPGSLYEDLLTQKERKLLGQVYTPFEIIDHMLNSISNFKAIDENSKILDPSCGGGFFLIELYKHINKSHPNIDNRHIIEKMLYGIDIDDFSIFLTKMGLIFHSGLFNLDFNIFKGDFLLDSLHIGDFDIIIGNPPYIGHKSIDENYRNLLVQQYSDVYYDKADLSYCFFKRGKEALKFDGIISFITSRYFMEAFYADRLRNFLKNNFTILSLVDYNGDTPFKRAMVSPGIITLSNIGNKRHFTYVKKDRYAFQSYEYKQDKLKDSGWIILKDEDDNLFEKIESISNTYIGDISSIKQGIITGCDRAFVVTEDVIEKYKIEDFLLKKWIKNSNISRESIKYNNLYLLYSNIIEDEKDYPMAINYLSQYKNILIKRRECVRGLRKWYQLQWARNKSDYENPKIIFPYKSKENNFYYDREQYFSSADVYIMNDFSKDLPLDYLLAYLNSNVFEFYLKCQVKKVGNNIYEYYPNKLKNLKIYLPQDNRQQFFALIGKFSIEILLQKLFNIDESEVNIIKSYL